MLSDRQLRRLSEMIDPKTGKDHKGRTRKECEALMEGANRFRESGMTLPNAKAPAQTPR